MQTATPNNHTNPDSTPSPVQLERVATRTVFAVEKLLEDLIVADLRNEGSRLAAILDLDIDVYRVEVQKPNGSLRPDIAIRLNRNGRADDAAADTVIEITLESLDYDHLHRGILYALACSASELVLLTPHVSDRVRQSIEQYVQGLTFGVTVLIINTYQLPDGTYAISYSDALGVETTSLTREQDFLRRVQEQLRAAGESSLDHVAVQSNGRLEINSEGARYTVRAGKRSASISLGLRDKTGATAQKTFNIMLQNMATIEGTAKQDISWGGSPGRTGGPRLATAIKYPRELNSLSNTELDDTAAEVARTYIHFRAATTRYI